MAFRAIISMIILSSIVTIWALPIQGSEISSEKFPYLGQVIGTDVYVRSGYGDPDGQNNFYPCTKVSEPTNVKVIALRNGWLQIEPVAGCFSIISKRFVKLDFSGKTGTVTGDDVRVRAGGQMRDSNFLAEHQRLDDGHKVIVLGEVSDKFGDWYKIAPPEGAYYWIYGEYVAQVGGPEPQEDKKSAAPSDSEDTQVEQIDSEKKVDEKAIDSTPPAQPVDALLGKIQKLEEQLKAEYEKSLPQRDYPSLLSAYKALRIPPDSYLKPRVGARISSLEKAIGQRAEMDQIQGIIADTLAQRKQMEMNRTRTQVEVQVESGQRKYAAQGVLAASKIFSGSAATAKRYLIRKPGSRKILAYVQSPDGQVDLDSYVGMAVGIHGPAKYSPSIALNLIDAISVVVLDETPQLLGLPKPIIKMPPVQVEKPAEVIQEGAEPEKTSPENTGSEATKTEAPATNKTEESSQAKQSSPTTQPTETDNQAEDSSDKSDVEADVTESGLPIAGETVEASSTKEINEAEYE